MKKILIALAVLVISTSAIACFGDVNNDNEVNPLDLGAVFSRFCEQGTCTQENLDTYDVNQDGAINTLDTDWIVQHYGQCSEQPPTDTDFAPPKHKTSAR